MHVTIYHNPESKNSRHTLSIIRNAGIEPSIVEYLTDPPDRVTLAYLIAHAGLTVYDVVRKEESVYAELELDLGETSEDDLLLAMANNPILINRPFVFTSRGVRLCRPPETVFDILSDFATYSL